MHMAQALLLHKDFNELYMLTRQVMSQYWSRGMESIHLKSFLLRNENQYCSPGS